MAKNTICLWYEHDAEEAARFYAGTFPQSRVGTVHRAQADCPDGKAGDAPDDQEETDRYWNTIVGNGGQEASAAGARTNGALAGRSPRGCRPMHSPGVAMRPSARSRR